MQCSPLGKKSSMKTNRWPQRGPIMHANSEESKKYNRNVVDYPDLGLKWHGLCLPVYVWQRQQELIVYVCMFDFNFHLS